MTPHLVRPLAVWLALAGQFVGLFGVPVVRGGSFAATHRPDSACGCCPADRNAGRCCCARPPVKSCCGEPALDDEVPPCCRGRLKKADEAVRVTWVNPVLRQKCLGPNDQAPIPTGEPTVRPEPPLGWAADPAHAGRVPSPALLLSPRSVPPDDPPPRSHARTA